MVMGVCFPRGIYQRGAHKRTANVLGQAQALAFVTIRGSEMGVRALMLCLEFPGSSTLWKGLQGTGLCWRRPRQLGLLKQKQWDRQ